MKEDRDVGAASFRASINAAPIRRFQALLVMAVLFVLVIDGLDLQLLSLVAPLILAEWGLDRSQFGVPMSAALVGMSVGTLIGGALGDRIGRRTVLLLSTLLFGGATFAAGASDTVPMLSALRLLSGLGFGAAAPNGVALASDWLPDRLRPQITSLLSIGTPAGGMIGAALMLGILPYTGWRGAFYACGVLTLLLALGVLLFIRESPLHYLAKGKPARAKAQLARHLDLTIAGALPQQESRLEGERSGSGFGFFNRSLLRLNLGAGLGFFALSFVSYAFIAWTPLMLSSVGFDVDQAITASFSFNLSAVGAALVGGFLMARFGTRLVLASTTMILVGALLALGAMLHGFQAQSGQDLAVYILIGAAGAFAGVGMASFYTIMAVGYPAACRAGGLGFGLMMGRIGGILASFSGGYLIDMSGAGLWVFILVLIACTVVASLCAFIFDRHTPPRSTPGAGIRPVHELS